MSILKAIGDFFTKKLPAFLKSKFGGKKAEEIVKDVLEDIVEIGKKLLQYASDPAALAIATAVLPEKYKDKTPEEQQKIIAVLTKAINAAGITNTCLNISDPFGKIVCFVGAIHQYTDIMKNKSVLAVASHMLQQQAPGLPESVADSLITSRIAGIKIDTLQTA